MKLGSFGSATTHLPGCFALGPYWILDLTCYLRTPYVTFRFSTRIFYRGVPGFATDCPLRCLPCVGPFWRSSLKWLLVYNGERPFIVFNFVCTHVFTYIFIPHNMIILIFIYLFSRLKKCIFSMYSVNLLKYRRKLDALYCIINTNNIVFVWLHTKLTTTHLNVLLCLFSTKRLW